MGPTISDDLQRLLKGSALPPLSRLLVNMAVRWALWRRNYRTRKQLAMLNEYELRDVGLTKAQVSSEIRKPFYF